MNKENILKKVSEVFASVLEHNNFELKEETTANDVDGWESITHMLIINEVERIFDIKFKLMDLMSMDNVGDLLKSISKELNENE